MKPTHQSSASSKGSPRKLHTALDEYTLRFQPAVAMGLAAFGAVFAVVESRIRPDDIVVPAVASDLILVVVGVFVWAMLRLSPPTPKWAHPIGFCLALVALSKNLLTIALTQDPSFTSVTSVNAIGIALLLLSTPWYLSYLFILMTSWGTVGYLLVSHSFIIDHSQPLAVSAFFGVVINVAVVRTGRAMEELRLQNERQKADLAAALASAQMEIERRAAAEERAERASGAKTQFLANMSHELRTPLNSIIGYSEMIETLARRAGHTEYLRDLSRIYVSGHHLLDLINEILDLSKVEAGKMDRVIEEFDVGRIAREVVEMVTPMASKNGNRLILDLEPGIPPMRSDAGRLRQILLNLLSNACKFTQEGEVALEIHQASSPGRECRMLTFAVRDTGIGMTEEQLDAIFQPFAQADGTVSRRYGGTGLGLAIAGRLAQLLGGDIDVKSAFGKGSTFTLDIPRLLDQQVEDGAAARVARA